MLFSGNVQNQTTIVWIICTKSNKLKIELFGNSIVFHAARDK